MTVTQQLAEANTHLENGRLDAAADVYERILAAAPQTAEALYHSGMIAFERGDLDRAVERLARAVAVTPDFLPLRHDYGAVLRAAGRDRDAMREFQAVLQRRPNDGNALFNLGLTQRGLGDVQSGLAAVDRAVALLPPFAPGRNAQGVMRRELGDLAGAAEAFRQAIAIDPAFVDAHSNLGLALHELGRSEEAEAALHVAVQTDPAFAPSHVNFGALYLEMGDTEAATAALGRAVALDPAREEARAPLVYLHHYDPAWTGEAILPEARAWAAAAMATLREDVRPVYPNSRDPARRLRIGYVSPDFREHACAHFLLPLLMAHDRAKVEVFAYANVERPDAITRRFQALADGWIDITRMTSTAVAQRVAADGIDILVDCAGLTRGNRLGVFAFRPAPVQVSWLGYPGTTGLDAIGYRITDSIADPPGMTDGHYSETLVRLARPFLAWEPPPLPAQAERAATGPVMFGSFSNPAKLNASVAQAWTRIVNAVPDARLTLKYSWSRWPRAERRVRGLFTRAGLAPDRLIFADWIPDHRAHFHSYEQIDIALDPFPYNGTTTTLEALWMGAPVITLAGERHSARVGAALLTAAGLPELIAPDTEAYVAAAIALAGDPARLLAYHRSLRTRVAQSPLVDALGFAQALEGAYRELWRSWCAR